MNIVIESIFYYSNSIPDVNFFEKKSDWLIID